jgi:hypothetical protein
MKVLLTILCAIVALFAGGCTLLIVGGTSIGGALNASPLALLPGGLAALNVLVIGALWGKIKAQPWAFLALAILDAIVFAILAFMAITTGARTTAEGLAIVLPLAAVAAKGILTFFYWKTL